MEEQYIQNWDNKSGNSSKLSFLYGEKIKSNYNKCMYFYNVVNIEQWRIITKLR